MPSSKEPLFFYSNQTRHDLKLLFCSAFKSAKDSIYMRMYGITDSDVIFALEKKAAAGIPTTVEYDKSASSRIQKKDSSIDAYPLKLKGLMHRKVVVIDQSLVFLGSANLTNASLKHHDNLVVGVFHPELAYFLRLSKQQNFNFELSGKKAELWLLPDHQNAALNRLINELNHAQKSIQIAMFTLTHPTITQALIQAYKRGVLVQVAIDYYTAQGASCKTITALENEKIPIYKSRGQQLLHHKWALIDQKNLVMGSANWTKAAFTKNEDFLLFLLDLSKDHQKFMQNLWEIIETESF